MLQNYSNDCDYLRKKFKLRDDVSLYELVHVVTNFIRITDDEEELQKLKEEVVEVEEISPETKDEPISQEKEPCQKKTKRAKKRKKTK